MEAKGNARRAVVMVAMIFLLVGRSSAAGKPKCIAECLHECILLHHGKWVCVPLCAAKCVLIKEAPEGEVSCAEECIRSSCLELDPEGDAMQDCLHSCANCTRPISRIETKS